MQKEKFFRLEGVDAGAPHLCRSLNVLGLFRSGCSRPWLCIFVFRVSWACFFRAYHGQLHPKEEKRLQGALKRN